MRIHIQADGLAGDMEQTMTMEMTVTELKWQRRPVPIFGVTGIVAGAVAR